MQTLNTTQRFAFGKNWSNFLVHLNQDRIEEAKKSLLEKLGCDNLEGKTFLDVGSGSGLFSLAAHLLGARVFSFDYDVDSVRCTQYLKNTYANKQNGSDKENSVIEWSVEQGSVLDRQFLKKFGQVDIVYSWGVLHHTGHMEQAFENISTLVKNRGQLFISIYNDQGRISNIWTRIKKAYVSYRCLRPLIIVICGLWLWKYNIAYGLFHHANPFYYIFKYGENNRGMSAWHDLVDWVGGYPFEVAKPEKVFNFFKEKGFRLEKIKTCGGGLGCNEFVFNKD